LAARRWLTPSLYPEEPGRCSRSIPTTTARSVRSSSQAIRSSAKVRGLELVPLLTFWKARSNRFARLKTCVRKCTGTLPVVSPRPILGL
jgi:hypothetical protein